MFFLRDVLSRPRPRPATDRQRTPLTTTRVMRGLWVFICNHAPRQPSHCRRSWRPSERAVPVVVAAAPPVRAAAAAGCARYYKRFNPTCLLLARRLCIPLLLLFSHPHHLSIAAVVARLALQHELLGARHAAAQADARQRAAMALPSRALRDRPRARVGARRRGPGREGKSSAAGTAAASERSARRGRRAHTARLPRPPARPGKRRSRQRTAADCRCAPRHGHPRPRRRRRRR